VRTLAAVVLVPVERNRQVGILVDEGLELGERGKGRAAGVARGWMEVEFADRDVFLRDRARHISAFGVCCAQMGCEAERSMALGSQLEGTCKGALLLY